MRPNRAHFVPAAVAALGLLLPANGALAGGGGAGNEAQAAAAAAPPAPEASIPIELPAGPAEPRPDELAGGVHGFLLFLGVVAVVAVVAAIAAHHYHYHHHGDGHDCEWHWHHHPAKPKG